MTAHKPLSQGYLPVLGLQVGRLEKTMTAIGSLGMFSMMIILVVDVLGRYLFNRPLSWSYDLISVYLLPTVVFLPLSDAFRKNQHVSVGLLYDRLGTGAQRALRLLASIVIAAVLAPIAWLAFLQAASRFRNHDVMAGSILWPTWIPSLILAIGSSLLVLRALVDASSLTLALARGSSHVPGESKARQGAAAMPENAL